MDIRKSELSPKGIQIGIIGIVVLDDREGDELVLVLELGLLYHFVEEARDLGRGIVECSAAESAQDKRIVVIVQPDAEDRPDLVLGYSYCLLRQMAVGRQLDGILPVQV